MVSRFTRYRCVHRGTSARPALSMDDVAQYVAVPAQAALALAELRRLSALELIDTYTQPCTLPGERPR
jgi:hypothetical protein